MGANRRTLRHVLLEATARRHRAMGDVGRERILDIDSMPIVVHGHQPGSEHNGHYHARVYHPLVASLGEFGDLLDVRLRPGNVHTATGALEFVLPLLDGVERRLGPVTAVRVDAGFPEEEFLAALKGRRTPYLARVRNNPVLDRMAQPRLKRPVGRPPAEPREWIYEMRYQAKSWARPRRVVLVVQERPDELFLHHFFLVTSFTAAERDGAAVLEMYRQRGTAEMHMGEFVNVLEPLLSSAPRPKSVYRGKRPRRRYASADSFAINEVLLLLNALAYDIAHAVRCLAETVTQEGWSLERCRERILRGAARVLVHGRRATVVLGRVLATQWAALIALLGTLRPAET